MSILSRLEPNIEKEIDTELGERLIAETGKHWKVTFFPWIRVVIGSLIALGGLVFDSSFIKIALGILGLVIIGQALWFIVYEQRDRFVITNQRIFRVWGVFNMKKVSVPLLRILDITVDKPILGRILGYGHFTFKSAAEVEGLNFIDHVPDIEALEGYLRASMTGQRRPVPETANDGT